MPPKQDSNSDCITALEGSITSILEKLQEASKATDKRFLEMEKRAEERHIQSMASKEKPSGASQEVTENPGNPRSKTGVADEAQRFAAEGSHSQADGSQKRAETCLLQLPEAAIPLRSAEVNTLSNKGGSSGYSSQQKGGSSPKKLDLPEFEGKNPDDWIFRVVKCFKVNQTEE